MKTMFSILKRNQKAINLAEEPVMKEAKIEKCPFCGGENFIETKVNSYGSSYSDL